MPRGAISPILGSLDGVVRVEGLLDVNAHNPSNGNVLIYNSATDTWNAGAVVATGTSLAMADLTNFSNPQTLSANMVVFYNGTGYSATLITNDMLSNGSIQEAKLWSGFVERIQDIVGSMFVTGTETTPVYNDSAGTLQINIDSSAFSLRGLSDTALTVSIPTGDLIRWDGSNWVNVGLGTMLSVSGGILSESAGSGGSVVISLTSNDFRTATFNSLVEGDNVTIARDAQGRVRISSTGGGGGGAGSPEQIRDVISSAMRGSNGITVTPNDSADTITVALTGGLSDLSDTDVASLANGETLVYDSSDQTWYNDTLPTDGIRDDAVTAAKLAVSGNGTAGQVLTSDADGTMSWKDDAVRQFATQAQNEAGTANDVAMTPQGHTQAQSYGWNRFRYTGFTFVDSSPTASGHVFLANNNLTVRPTSQSNRVALSSNLVAGRYVSFVGDGRLVSGIASSVTGGDGSNDFVVSLSTPYTDVNATSGSVELFIEGTEAYRSRTGPLAPSTVGALELKVTGNGTDGQVLISEGDGSFRFGDQAAGPAKASVAEMEAGTDDAKYATARGVAAAIERNDEGSVPEAVLTGMSLIGNASLSAVNQMKVNTAGNDLNVRLAATRYATLKPLLKKGAQVRILASNGDVELSTTLDRDEEFDESASTDDLVLQIDGTGDLTDAQTLTNASLEIRAAWADSWDQYLYGKRKEELKVTGNATITHDDATQTSTINVTGGGGGSVSYATQAETNAGTITNKAVNPATLHGAFEHLAHVATYVGFEFQPTINATGTDLAEGKFHINEAGTEFYARGHAQAEGVKMTQEFLVDRSCIMTSRDGRLDFDFTNVVSVAVSGSLNPVVKVTITNHQATPADPILGGDRQWSISIMPEQNKQIFEHVPAKVLDGIALKDGAVGPREAEGLFQKTACKLRDTNWIELNNESSTRRTETYLTSGNENANRAKQFVIAGTGAANTVSFDQILNHSMVPGTITHSTMRALPGESYSCRMDGIGTFYCGTGANHGIEMGMQFRHKAITSSTWGSWQDCTIVASSDGYYDPTKWFGSSSIENVQPENASGNSRLASLFREKRRQGGSEHMDVSPPFFAQFGVGTGEVFVPGVSGRDFQFRFVFCPSGMSNAKVRKLYNYTEILTADRL